MKNGACVSNCEEGYYLDYFDRECVPCFEGCVVCNGPSEDECADEYFDTATSEDMDQEDTDTFIPS